MVRLQDVEPGDDRLYGDAQRREALAVLQHVASQPLRRGVQAGRRRLRGRDRVRLPVWILAQTALTGSSAFAVQGLYDTAAKQASYAASVGSSGASIAMGGPPVALDTPGGITVFEVNLSATIAVAPAAYRNPRRFT